MLKHIQIDAIIFELPRLLSELMIYFAYSVFFFCFLASFLPVLVLFAWGIHSLLTKPNKIWSLLTFES